LALESSKIQTSSELPRPRESRAKRKPIWMMDCVNADELFDKETNAQYALLFNSDPITFEEAIKETKW
jgi:hypothetical protein